jgi:hypothetical protein
MSEMSRALPGLETSEIAGPRELAETALHSLGTIEDLQNITSAEYLGIYGKEDILSAQTKIAIEQGKLEHIASRLAEHGFWQAEDESEVGFFFRAYLRSKPTLAAPHSRDVTYVKTDIL